MMKLSAIVLCTLLAFSHAANWAVLVAGSNGFWNYRHQADVSHAYQDLVKGGFNPENIITFMYDDIAGDSSNPFPGKIFNKPSNGTGRDVYAGVKIDYKGVYVTSKNFLGALTGKPAFAGAKVLKSGPEDNVFVFFSDHGGPGLICFPSDDLLAADLIKALTEMHTSKMYKKFVFYLESCESGSMFDGLLNSNLGIYAVTAANKDESSWGTYCSPNDVVDGKHIGSCLGDLFSISWMEDVDVSNTHKETLEEQFHKLVVRTNLSHVSRFGDLSYTSDVLADYIDGPALKEESVESISLTSSNLSPYDAKLAMLNWRVQEVQNCRCVHPLYGDYQKVVAERDQELFERGRSSWIFAELWSRMTGSKEGMLDKSRAPRNFECLGKVRNAYRQYCGPISDYAQQFSRSIVNLCESGRTTENLVSTLLDICRL